MAAIFKNGKKYVESMTSDLADKTVSTIDNVTTSYPEITTSDKGKTLFGKIKKYLSDLKNNKMDKENPTGTGSFSLNRKANTTIGNYSFAEGYQTTASESYSHAEGVATIASGNSSHAEGGVTIASGPMSHAEGDTTVASGYASHAEGNGTTSQRKSQHVFGEYNVLDTTGTDTTTKGDYVEIVGNGTGTSARSNARTLDWDGNEVLAGSLTTTDVNTPSGSTWDGTNTSLATAISSLNSTLKAFELLGSGDGVSSITLAQDWNKYHYFLIEYKPTAGGIYQNVILPKNNLQHLASVYYSSTYYWCVQFYISTDGKLQILNNWTTGKYNNVDLTTTSFDVYVYGILFRSVL